jgi:3-oxoacyl-[acyl-carrier-protein] synthase-3
VLQSKCELVNAAAWSLDVGCASFQAHAAAAAALIRAGTVRHVLSVLSSAVSLVLDYREGWSPNFGDGAAAMVIGPGARGAGLLGHYARTDGSLREGVVYAPCTGNEITPDWYHGNGRVRLVSLDTDGGKRAGMLSTTFCRDACLGALASAGVSLEDVDLFLCNQSVGWLVDACRRALNLSAEKTLDTFAEVANIGAAVIPMHLERARQNGKLKDGGIVLAYSPGAGLTRAAVVWRWTG